jgi:hypothetical protein
MFVFVSCTNSLKKKLSGLPLYSLKGSYLNSILFTARSYHVFISIWAVYALFIYSNCSFIRISLNLLVIQIQKILTQLIKVLASDSILLVY